VVEGGTSFVAECFWPGVRETDLTALDRRATAAAASEHVRYLGSILMRDDEVVLCLFEGPADAVQRAAVQAAIPFERVLATTHSPWPVLETAGPKKEEKE
jgi:Protein of unknown function (DUF4242)